MAGFVERLDSIKWTLVGEKTQDTIKELSEIREEIPGFPENWDKMSMSQKDTWKADNQATFRMYNRQAGRAIEKHSDNYKDNWYGTLIREVKRAYPDNPNIQNLDPDFDGEKLDKVLSDANKQQTDGLDVDTTFENAVITHAETIDPAIRRTKNPEQVLPDFEDVGLTRGGPEDLAAQRLAEDKGIQGKGFGPTRIGDVVEEPKELSPFENFMNRFKAKRAEQPETEIEPLFPEQEAAVQKGESLPTQVKLDDPYTGKVDIKEGYSPETIPPNLTSSEVAEWNDPKTTDVRIQEIEHDAAARPDQSPDVTAEEKKPAQQGSLLDPVQDSQLDPDIPEDDDAAIMSLWNVEETPPAPPAPPAPTRVAGATGSGAFYEKDESGQWNWVGQTAKGKKRTKVPVTGNKALEAELAKLQGTKTGEVFRDPNKQNEFFVERSGGDIEYTYETSPGSGKYDTKTFPRGKNDAVDKAFDAAKAAATPPTEPEAPLFLPEAPTEPKNIWEGMGIKPSEPPPPLPEAEKKKRFENVDWGMLGAGGIIGGLQLALNLAPLWSPYRRFLKEQEAELEKGPDYASIEKAGARARAGASALATEERKRREAGEAGMGTTDVGTLERGRQTAGTQVQKAAAQIAGQVEQGKVQAAQQNMAALTMTKKELEGIRNQVIGGLSQTLGSLATPLATALVNRKPGTKEIDIKGTYDKLVADGMDKKTALDIATQQQRIYADIALADIRNNTAKFQAANRQMQQYIPPGYQTGSQFSYLAQAPRRY